MRNEQFSQREKLEKKDWIQRQAEQMPRLDFWRKEGPVSFLRSAGCSSRYTEVASDGTMNPRSRLSQFVAAPRYFFWIPSARQQAIKMRVKVKKWIIAQHQFCNWFLLFIFFCFVSYPWLILFVKRLFCCRANDTQVGMKPSLANCNLHFPVLWKSCLIKSLM